MKKQIVITRVLEFGGSNTYLKTLIRYLGKENLILILTNEEDLVHLNKIDPNNEIPVKVFHAFYDYAKFDLKSSSILNIIREIFYVLRALSIIFLLSAKNGFASISISVINPERYLYLLWLPIIKVKYILHSDPLELFAPFTTITCNTRLSNKKIIITVSKANRKSIISSWNVSERKSKNIHVVYNCLVEDERERKNTFKNDELQVILTMGHVVEYKNPYLWLDVARRVVSLRRNTFFFWLGNGRLLEVFQEQTKNNEFINFTGLIENPSSYMEKATLYYQPSLNETQGIAVIEAMSHSLPCVVSNVGGLPESVENNKNGFIVDINDTNENVKRIIELLDNKELCISFGLQSFERYKKHFNFARFKKEMDNFFN